MIRLHNVIKRFRQGEADIAALDGVSLEVPDGEFLAVMGPSGSGKSTLLHLIGGLDSASSGEIEIRGTRLSAMSDDAVTLFRRRHVGFVFQFFHLLPSLSVEENVALPLLLDGHRLGSVREKIDAVLSRIGLEARRRHRAAELSGGEMQRVAIARALIIEPTLLLADEPTGNLDSRTGEQILELIRSVVKERGRTTIMVTHDPKSASYGDRVVAMKDGRIVGETRVTNAPESPPGETPVDEPGPHGAVALSNWYRRIAYRPRDRG